MNYLRRALAFAAVSLSGLAFAANQAPTATLTSPSAGVRFYAPASISMTATASDADGSVAKVEFLNGTTVIPGSADTTSPYSFTWTNVPAGTYTLKARATDNLAKTGDSATVQITVYPITTVVLSPAANSVVAGRNVSVSGTFTGPDTTTIIVTGGAGHSVVASASGGNFTAAAVELLPGVNEIQVALARADGSAEVKSISVTSVDLPLVVVTGPQFCGPYSVPATVTLTADALSPTGQITKVDFYDSGTLVGTATSPPFVVTTTLSTVGDHAITAIATDSYGYTGSTFVARHISVQSQPPVASITSPADQATFRFGAPITLSATASDPDGTVSRVDFLRAGSIPIQSVPAAPYSYTWTTAPIGTHVLTAVATDNSNVTGAPSAARTISVVANVPPIISLTSPVSGATYNAPTDLVIEADASDYDGSVIEVEFFVDGLSFAKKNSPPYKVNWANVPLGNHTVRAQAKDNEGAISSTADAAISVNGVTASIIAPNDGATFAAPATFNISATASTSSGTITKLEFLDGPVVIQTFDTAATTVNASVARSETTGGTHAYSVRATDSGNRSATSGIVNVTVTAPTAPPSVTLTSPSPATYYLAPASLLLRASVTPGSNAIQKVEFFAGTVLIGTISAPPYEATWSNVAGGSYSLTAKVQDSAGLSTTSTPVVVTVAASPTVSVAGGIDGSSVSDDQAGIHGTVQAGPNSAVSVNGLRASLSDNGTFFVNNVPLNLGANQIEVNVTGQDGQTSSQIVTITSAGTSPFQISVDQEGLAPFETAVQVINRAQVPFSTIDFDQGDDGTIDFSVPTLDGAQISLNYATAGVRLLRVTVRDLQGAIIHSEVKRILVEAPLARYQVLKGVFDDLRGRLADGNIDGAVNMISVSHRERYRDYFTSLGPDLANVVAGIGSVSKAKISQTFGFLTLVRTETDGDYGYVIPLIRDESGIWRIDGM